MESKKWYCDQCECEFETQEELDDHFCVEPEDEDEDIEGTDDEENNSPAGD